MVSRAEFEKILSSVGEREKRIAAVGALLARATGVSITVVGGSAISLYTSGNYVSKDIDLVGSKRRIAPILKQWGFHLDTEGERPYWVRDDLGLLIDISRPRYRGLEGHIRTLDTPYGPVSVAAPEDLILRRLIFSKHRQSAAMSEAEMLWDRFHDVLDYDYLEAEARYEHVVESLQNLRRRRAVP